MAEGETVISDASELRVKESDRISSMAANLKALGINVSESPDGMTITGRGSLDGIVAQSHGDHRIAMSLSVAGLVAGGQMEICDTECVATSFPNFYELLEMVAVR